MLKLELSGKLLINYCFYSDHLVEFCGIHSQVSVPHPDNCALYLDCKKIHSSNPLLVQECPYPQLFSTQTMKCQPFYTVQCHGKKEPMAPCKFKILKYMCIHFLVLW